MARTPKAAKGLQADLIARATGKNQEPEWNMLTAPSRVQLSRAFSAYSLNTKKYKLDDYKSFAIAWAKKNRPDLLETMEQVKPYRFMTFGPLMRMHTRGMIWDEKVKAKIDEFLTNLASFINAPDDELDELDEDGNLIDAAPKPKAPKRPKLNPNMQGFDDTLDSVLEKWNPANGIGFEVDPMHDVADVIARAQDALDNFKVEGEQQYPLHMKVWFKAVIDKLSGIQKIVKVRKPRMTRVRKVNPLKMTAKVKYLRNDSELKIDSKSPVDLVGKTKVYIYDTKYKKLTKLTCAEASGFVIKGTTIQNFDPDKSSVAFLRKPKNELNTGMGIRELDRVMNSTKSKRQVEPKGRLNEYTLILSIS